MMNPLATLYLNQLKRSLTDTLNQEVPDAVYNPPSLDVHLQPAWFDHFFFGHALTMCSLRRLDNLQICIEDCLVRGVPGDIVETGAWRGGGAILMRGVLAAHGVTDRTIWVADSFAGLPAPVTGSVDEALYNHDLVIRAERFAVDLTTVKANFARYGLLDDQVRFLPGWFKETLPFAPIQQVAVLRLDGDFYEGTLTTLETLYPKVSPGGYVIVDDWGADQLCGEKQAVQDYRQTHQIVDEVVSIDYHSAYWRKNG